MRRYFRCEDCGRKVSFFHPDHGWEDNDEHHPDCEYWALVDEGADVISHEHEDFVYSIKQYVMERVNLEV